MTQPKIDTNPELRPAGDAVPQEWSRLATYLAAQGLVLSLDEPPASLPVAWQT